MRIPTKALATLLLACLPSLACASDLAIVGARIQRDPASDAIANGTIVVRDGRINAVGPSDSIKVPEGVAIIDGKGSTVVAGFWNSHVHLMALPLRESMRPAPELGSALRDTFARWGFTSVFDLASLPGTAMALRRRIDAGELAGPMILTVDGPFFPKDGTPIYVRDLLSSIGAPDLEVDGADVARTRARAQLAAGADGVKLFAGAIVGGPIGVLPMDPAIAAAAAAEAHHAGKPVFAHPSDMPGLEVAIAAGTDVLTHTTPADAPWSNAFVARLVREDIALTPTLMLIDVELGKEQAPQPMIERFHKNAAQQLAAFARAGGQVLFGTDVGYIDVADPHREFELMAAAGLDWRAILASLTTNPARRFGFADRKGRIAVGMDADLVVLGADPSAGVAAFSAVRYTVRRGEVLFTADTARSASASEQVRRAALSHHSAKQH